MFIEIKTTITSRLRLGDEGVEGIDHTAEVDGTDAEGMPTNLMLIVANAGCRASAKTLAEKIAALGGSPLDEEEN